MTSIRAFCTHVFLRLYAHNLERSRRGEPDAACSDAMIQTAMFLALPVVSTGWLATAMLWPPFAQHVGRLDSTFLLPSIALGLLIGYWVNRQFRNYSASPQVAREYRHRGVFVVFVGLPVVWVILVGLALRALTRTR